MTMPVDEPRNLRRFLPRALLLLGLVLALTPLAQHLPREQTVELELDRRTRATLSRLDLSWSREGESEELGGISRRFPHGAPGVIRETFNAPNGRYTLRVSTEHASSDRIEPPSRSFERSLNLVGETAELSL